MTRTEIISEVFCDSLEIREFLLQKENCSDRDLLDAVCGAPIALQRKLEMLESYAFDVASHFNGEGVHAARLTALREAVAQLDAKEGDVFLWRNRWYDLEMAEVDGEPIDQFDFRPCRTIEDVFEDVQAVIASEKENGTEEYQEIVDERFVWLEIKKFEMSSDCAGRRQLVESPWSWIAVDSRICYADYTEHTVPTSVISKELKAGVRAFSSAASMDLNLRIPFKVGDRVVVDCRPFAPINHMLLTAVGDDCCGVRVAFVDARGKSMETSLKHGHCFTDNYHSVISPLYRIRPVFVCRHNS